MSQFQDDIVDFNAIYKLPIAPRPTLNAVGNPIERLHAFKDILREELDEIDEVIRQVDDALAEKEGDSHDLRMKALTSLADLLGDLQVYCASEMVKFGLPVDETLSIIMQSNFSKLGADGKPIYDERGKVQKGPNYWKPEPKIEEILRERILSGE